MIFQGLINQIARLFGKIGDSKKDLGNKALFYNGFVAIGIDMLDKFCGYAILFAEV